ncbi:MAG: helix-turn-helix domain-containing protein [Nitrososphaerota archaeon]
MGVLNKLFGPSIYLLVLDMFIENPDKMINLREISRLVNKNPGSVTRVMAKLVKNGFLKQTKIGKVSYVYNLNIENEKVKLLIDFYKKLKEIEEKEIK